MPVPEAPIEHDEHGAYAAGDGWFVLNAREARWRERGRRGFSLPFEGATEFPQVGVVLFVLPPGEAIGLYHWEADQEDFLVLAGKPLLLIEGAERPLRPWDFVHCPPHVDHMIIGAGDGPSVVLGIGARAHQEGDAWGGYPVSELALRHGVGVESETSDADEAYGGYPDPFPTRYGDWLS